LPAKITGQGWKRIGVRDHYGIDVPLLSLHGKLDSGCGEFYDLFPLIEWLQSLEMDILQLLPLNDTGTIVSPYSPLSFYALHPIYLTLDVLPFLQEASSDLHTDLKDLKTLNRTKRVDYFQVLEKKTAFLEEYVRHFQQKLLSRSSYQEFMKRSSYWISDYALYKVLSKKFGHEWQKWPKELQYPHAEKLDQLKKQYSSEMLFYQVVQSLCYEQMDKVHQYANQQGVFLLGDLTFLVDANSSIVWLHPEFFNLDKSMGVPVEPGYPDGQYWALPPYNWKVIEESGSRMLLERVRNFSQLYDLYRLDSCLGYFSQFEIPINSHPREGAFVPSDPDEAFQSGSKILISFINEMPQFLPYAEAFSMSPRMLEFLEAAGIVKLKTIVGNNSLFPRRKMILNGKEQVILELFMLSNHDNLPLRRWWYENPKEAGFMAKQYGWRYTKHLSRSQQLQLIRKVYDGTPIFHINMLYDLLPPHLTWPPEDEGINIPGTKSDKNWTYRFKLSVEELTANREVRSFVAPPKRVSSTGFQSSDK